MLPVQSINETTAQQPLTPVINVSVVIAVKNEEIYISQALRSILEQQGLNFEVIVIDDGSTDKTFEIAESFKPEFSNLTLMRNPKPGKARAFNLGVSMAKGDFVCLFAGDDIMPPGSLLKRWQVVSSSENPAYAVGLCKLLCISEDKKFDGKIVPKKPGVGGFTGLSYMMGKSATNEIFPVPESLPNEDSWMYYGVTMLPKVKMIHSDIIGSHWRVHAGNSINFMVDFKTYNEKITPRNKAPFVFYEKFKDQLPEKTLNRLLEEIKTEEKRLKGDVVGIMFAKMSLVERLRFVSMTNSFFYNLRKVFFKFFSGW